MTTLTELQNTAFLTIGPCRIAALSLLALMNEEDENPKAEEIFRLSASRLQRAHEMLTVTVPKILETNDYSFPDPLQEKQQASIEALAPFIEVLQRADGRVANLPKAPEALSAHCLYVMEPVVTEFMTDMTQNLLDFEKTRLEARETEMLEAIESAEAVGRNIQLIAFNASIEAARIGDMGKGFAVIATEIRELSGKTQRLLDDIAGFLRH